LGGGSGIEKERRVDRDVVGGNIVRLYQEGGRKL